MLSHSASVLRATGVNNVQMRGLPTVLLQRLFQLGRHQSSSDGRSIYLAPAAVDPVEDYRQIAASGIWGDILGSRRDLRYLDVCCGTGRWSQAFAESVLREKNLKASADFVDLCSESLTCLEERLTTLPAFERAKTHCLDAGQLDTLDGNYDTVVNMHGLYAVPRPVLEKVLAAMFHAVAPGGNMIIALGDVQSFYWKYSQTLVDCGVMPIPYTSAEDVTMVLADLGIEFSVKSVPHVQRVSDEGNLHHFLENECGGNTWTTADEHVGKAVKAIDSHEVQTLIKSYRSEDGAYHFPQTTSLIVAHRPLIPQCRPLADLDMKFYREAFALRNQASSMVPQQLAILQNVGRELDVGHELSILSIGCGDGELECALLAGVAEQSNRPSINFVGLDPNDGSVDNFRARIRKMEHEGTLPSSWFDPTLQVRRFDSSLPAELNQRFDIVLLGHVLYYFEDKGAAIELAMQLTKPTGDLMIIHQGPEGVPEIQSKFTKTLSGEDLAMCTSDDLEQLCRSLPLYIGSIKRQDYPAYLDVGPALERSPEGLDVLSFAIECDLRTATPSQLSAVLGMVRKLAVPNAESGRTGGPFLRETLSVLTAKPADIEVSMFDMYMRQPEMHAAN